MTLFCIKRVGIRIKHLGLALITSLLQKVKIFEKPEEAIEAECVPIIDGIVPVNLLDALCICSTFLCEINVH